MEDTSCMHVFVVKVANIGIMFYFIKPRRFIIAMLYLAYTLLIYITVPQKEVSALVNRIGHVLPQTATSTKYNIIVINALQQSSCSTLFTGHHMCCGLTICK